MQNLVQLNGTAGAGVSVQSNLAQSTFLTGQMADAEQAGVSPVRSVPPRPSTTNRVRLRQPIRLVRRPLVRTAGGGDGAGRTRSPDGGRRPAGGGPRLHPRRGPGATWATGSGPSGAGRPRLRPHEALVSPAFVTYNRVYTDLFAAEALDVTSCSLAQRYWVATEQALATAAVRAEPAHRRRHHPRKGGRALHREVRDLPGQPNRWPSPARDDHDDGRAVPSSTPVDPAHLVPTSRWRPTRRGGAGPRRPVRAPRSRPSRSPTCTAVPTATAAPSSASHSVRVPSVMATDTRGMRDGVRISGHGPDGVGDRRPVRVQQSLQLGGVGDRRDAAPSRATGAASSPNSSADTVAASSAPGPANRVAACTTTSRRVRATQVSTASRSIGTRVRRSSTSTSVPSSARASAAARASGTCQPQVTTVTSDARALDPGLAPGGSRSGPRAPGPG